MAKPRGVTRKNTNRTPKSAAIIKKPNNGQQGGYIYRRANRNFRATTPDPVDRLSGIVVKNGQIVRNNNRTEKAKGFVFKISAGKNLPPNVLSYCAEMTAPESDSESVIEEVQTVTIDDEDNDEIQIERKDLSTIIEIEEGEIISDDEEVMVIDDKNTSTNTVGLRMAESFDEILDDDVIMVDKVTNKTNGTSKGMTSKPTSSLSSLKRKRGRNPTFPYPDSSWKGYDESNGLEGTSTQYIELIDKNIKNHTKNNQFVIPTLNMPGKVKSPQKVIVHRKLCFPIKKNVPLPLLKFEHYLDSLSFHIAQSRNIHFRGPEKLSSDFPNDMLNCDPRIFRLICYNILSQKAMEDNDYLYGHLKGLEIQKTWPFRFNLLKFELLRLNADLYCLQEVDESAYSTQLEPLLKQFGYLGYYTKRGGEKTDGCAIFWRKRRFSLIESESLYLNLNVPGLDKPNVAQILIFEHVVTKRKFMIVNTHILFAPRRGDIKLNQLAYIFANMKKHQKKVEHVIFAGDLNTEPNSPIYNFIRNGILEIKPGLTYYTATLSGQIKKVFGKPMQNIILPIEAKIDNNCVYTPTIKNSTPKLSIRHSFNFANCYDHFTKNGQPEVSTFQRDFGNPDHIFYTVQKVIDKKDKTFEVHEKGLHLLRRLALPDINTLKSLSGSLPNTYSGSDHLPLLVEFYIY